MLALRFIQRTSVNLINTGGEIPKNRLIKGFRAYKVINFIVIVFIKVFVNAPVS